jgi:hypothetical protein
MDGVSSANFDHQDPFGQREERSLGQILGIASSTALHALVLLLLLLPVSRGVEGSHGAVVLVPIEIEATAKDARGQATDVVRHDMQTQSAPDSSSAGSNPGTDTLAQKLQALAQLRQPDTEPAAPQPTVPDSELLTTSDNAAPGQLAALRDFIRDQVERHWSPDLASLGTEEFSIPIRIEMTSTGTVLKADIVDTSYDLDPVYREVAASARNAVLSASPLSLPAGQYKNLMEFVLYLNPRKSLQ